MKAGDRLADYNAKRDFTRTKEPPGKAGKKHAKALSFVVQKHDATRLHWDFRLELDGVLLSWAVTRGPSRDPKVRRLAVRTEDHPLDYGAFEGTIPKGDYGGGTVMLWDRGTWEPIDEPREGVAKGKFHFRLFGERMKGEWVLIRLKPDSAKDKRENWLLFKIDDEEAKGPDLVDTYADSVASKRSMDAIAKGTASWPTRPRGTAKAQKLALPMPIFRPPQLATLVEAPPTGNDWLHETKYDGYRALVAVAGGKAQAFTRAGHDWTEKFARIADAAATLPVHSALIDGEICALNQDGRPGFSALQEALAAGGPLLFFAFDLLELDGADLSKQPLTERKAALATLLEAAPSQLIYAEHVRGGGERMFRALCDAGYEGVVSKRADAPYRSGRSKGWLKSKCTRRQEFVIAGWSASGKGRGFASLLLGLHGSDGLVYAGRVGTGFDARSLESLSKRLEALAVKKPAFAGPLPAETRGAHWVKPELVAEIAFAEFTGEGRVRHASFLGLREDKPAAEVKPEVTAKTKPPKKKPGGAAALAKTGITISSPDREVFPELGLTKQALAEYYALIAPAMLEDMAGRPVSLVRCPQGRGKQCFFQKHDSGMFPDSVRSVKITESSGKPEDYLVLESSEGIVACIQMGTIEFHGWGSRAADLERPDRLVFDLDPDEGIDFAAVKAAAVLVRDRLQALGLASLPMVTGGKGVHVIAPLIPDADWPAVKDFARSFAEALAAELPDAFVATMSKAKRKNRIFIDWLRNQRGATAAMPWSVRARDGAPVAVPVTWEVLDGLAAANGHSAADAAAILALASGRKRVKAAKLPG